MHECRPTPVLCRVESVKVTIDKSLQRKGRLVRTRNVLTRHERIEKLQSDERWIEGQSPFGLPKIRVIKAVLGKKKKKKTKEDADTDDTKSEET